MWNCRPISHQLSALTWILTASYIQKYILLHFTWAKIYFAVFGVLATFYSRLLPVIPENILNGMSLSSLFDLMVDKIEELKILQRNNANVKLCEEVRNEIQLIHKVIKFKKSNS